MTYIIIEGTDANFKSTVAEKLSKELNVPILKGSSFELSQCNNEELFGHFKEFSQVDNVIFDRFIYSNRVYATLYKDYAILTDKQRKEIEDLIKHKALLVYLHADTEVIKTRITERGDEYVDVSMVDKINKLYTPTILESKLKAVSYDTNEWDSSSIAEDIIKYLYDEQDNK
ncbi:deoxynucleoside kinase [Metabacillus fastidiosus]|uniref:deoxynucleoside kinase n=1 Tax=Metabacillus fastidiosus TaxID=1458 RepID=UPI003D29BDED